MQRVITSALFLVFCFLSGAPAIADEVRKLATEPRRTSDVGGTGSARLDFFFGDVRAWLREDGNWHIEGNIEHRGALCGDYELGIQFGIGSPGCANVEWMGKPAYVTRRRQCNNALLNHSGGDVDPAAAASFNRITCAQRLIRCTGNCK